MPRTPLPVPALQPFGVAGPADPPPVMLDFRGHDGKSFALPYRDLGAIAFDPTIGCRLEFSDHLIVVRGRNLRSVYDHLLTLRVTYLQEEDFDSASESDPFIDSISVERAGAVG